MSYTQNKVASFGPGKAGLATVGYTVSGGSRITAGVAEIGTLTGVYGATVTFADGFAGSILWDTGDSNKAYAAEDVNPSILDKTQKLSAPRDLSAVADADLTLNDALHCSIAFEAGKMTVIDTTYTVMTSAGATIRVFTLDDPDTPTRRD